jgi:hypothetical protein
LQDSVVRDILDFIPYDHDVEVKSLNIYGLRLIGQIFIDWHSNKVFEIIQNQKDMSYAQKAYQYRVLKENFHNTGEYIAEDKAYVAFKRNESKAQLNNVKEKGNPISKFVGYTLYYFKNILLDKAGLYATSPARVLFSMLVSYIFFSLIFELTTILKIGSFSASTGEGLLSEMGDSFYFSIITYLTVGYGDFSPLGINRWIAGLEGFVGVFLMSYFTVAFVRRILR